MAQSLHIKAQHYIVVWRDPDPLAEIPASHEGIWAESQEGAVSIVKEDMIEDGYVAVRAYGEGQVLRMYDFLQRHASGGRKRFIVFYDGIDENDFAPRDRIREGWVAVSTGNFEDALAVADQYWGDWGFRAFLAYDVDDIELVLEGLVGSRLLQQYE